jgi:hypothetical protein
MLAFFAVVGLWPVKAGGSPRQWAMGVAAGFALAALVRPDLLAIPNRVWTRFGMLLHKITNPLVMGVLFFGVVLPVAVLGRLLGRDPLRRRLAPEAQSYWIVREPPGPPRESLEQQF